MGKTKTAFVGGVEEGDKKSSYDKKAKEAKRKAREEAQKVHISGLKGGQRVKIVGAEEVVEAPVKPQSEEVKTESVSEKGESKKKIRVRGKKYLNNKSKFDPYKTYQTEEAIKLVKETSYSKFDGTVEMHLVVKKTGLSANVSLPFSSGKQKRVEIADEKTVEKLQKGKVDFDLLLSTAEMMPKLVPFAKILGPRGLMPNPKNGTIIKSAKDAEKFKGNSTTLKTEKDQPLVHTACGKVSQKNEELKANVEAVINAFGGNKQILKAYLKATMGPSIRLQI